ncbi:unnamed protein product [Rotaria sp. Silwood1]|nr:unnamed protein product [Rotaria sp. Silwood1]CAF1607829.1 unnamed protein product [Rotaria sp. Silwood1]CAF3693867.1 unnamed protein product [Rotaria sp. Silwood1]CAF3769417.1 unnamed protein product [Rotaria sp. Silwood1]CAF4617529.1 unnamed protein product [Rotaria sp. Silwood1]
MKTVVNSNLPLISNSFVTCYSDYLIIHLYYFPFGNKKIKYRNIRSCEFRSTNDIGMFEYKLWGMSLSPIWWHCDMNRLARKHYILLDANQWPLIGITMDDNEIINVYNLIRQKMNCNPSNIYAEKLPYNTLKTMSEKEIEHQQSLRNIQTK